MFEVQPLSLFSSPGLDTKQNTQCPAGVGCCVTDSFYVCQYSQHRQSSCAVYRTAALPVLAGLADVEGISHTAPNASGALCTVADY